MSEMIFIQWETKQWVREWSVDDEGKENFEGDWVEKTTRTECRWAKNNTHNRKTATDYIKTDLPGGRIVIREDG